MDAEGGGRWEGPGAAAGSTGAGWRGVARLVLPHVLPLAGLVALGWSLNEFSLAYGGVLVGMLGAGAVLGLLRHTATSPLWLFVVGWMPFLFLVERGAGDWVHVAQIAAPSALVAAAAELVAGLRGRPPGIDLAWQYTEPAEPAAWIFFRVFMASWVLLVAPAGLSPAVIVAFGILPGALRRFNSRPATFVLGRDSLTIDSGYRRMLPPFTIPLAHIDEARVFESPDAAHAWARTQTDAAAAATEQGTAIHEFRAGRTAYPSRYYQTALSGRPLLLRGPRITAILSFAQQDPQPVVDAVEATKAGGAGRP